MWVPGLGRVRPVSGDECVGACPVCGDPKHMYFNVRKSVWYCHKCGGSGRAGEETPVRPARPAEPPREAVPDPDGLDRAYSALLSCLSLSQRHLEHLISRGFPEELIREKGYRTLPERGRRELAERAAEIACMSGVPGFWRDEKGWRLSGPPGILVPFRDFENRIVGLQVRRDEGSPKYVWLSSAGKPGGAAARAVLHVAGWKPCPARVWVTEGPLKADYSAWKLGEPVLAIPGAALWRRAGVVPALLERGADRVVVAYDADWRDKKPVRQAMHALASALELAGFEVRVAVWPQEFKGLDDLLKSGGRPELVRLGGVGMQRAFVVGRVSNRPQVRKVKGQDCARLVVVTHQNGRKEAFEVSCWGKLAAQAAQLSPGELVEVEGKLRSYSVRLASGDVVSVVAVNAVAIEVWEGGDAGAGGDGH